jgi:hypothetical protein
VFELTESRVRGVKPAVRARDHDTVACAPQSDRAEIPKSGIGPHRYWLGEDCRRGQIYSMMSYGTGL